LRLLNEETERPTEPRFIKDMPIADIATHLNRMGVEYRTNLPDIIELAQRHSEDARGSARQRGAEHRAVCWPAKEVHGSSHRGADWSTGAIAAAVALVVIGLRPPPSPHVAETPTLPQVGGNVVIPKELANKKAKGPARNRLQTRPGCKI